MARKHTIGKPNGKPEKPRQKTPELIYESCRTLAFMSIEPTVEVGDIAYSWRIDIDTDIPNEIITVRVSIDGIHARKNARRKQMDDDGILFSIITANRFQGYHLANEIKVTDSRIELPAWIMATLASASLGTTRGILVAKLAGTIYSDKELPIFNLRTLMPGIEAIEVPIHGI